MKHMNLVHARTTAAGGYSLAMEGIAQEGFVDGFKDFFTFKAKPDNANALRNTGSAMRGLSRAGEKLRQFGRNTPTEAMRFLFRHEKLTLNLPRDIQTDAGTVREVNKLLSGIVGLLKDARLTDESNEIETKLKTFVDQGMKSLSDQTFLGNFYLALQERGTSEYDGSHLDNEIDPKHGGSGGGGLGGLLVNTIFYVFDRKSADKLLDKMNEVLSNVDKAALGTASNAFAKEMETAAGLVEQFLESYNRLRKSDNKHVRHTLRYGHNVIYVLTAMSRPYRAFAHYVV